VIEVHIAQGAPLVKHEEVLERLTDAVDGTRAQAGCRSASRSTAPLVVAAVESSLRSRLLGGDVADRRLVLRDLLHFVVLSFFGEEAARGAVDSL
jgi:hypothetical protein